MNLDAPIPSQKQCKRKLWNSPKHNRQDTETPLDTRGLRPVYQETLLTTWSHPLNGSHLKSYVTYTLYPSPSHPPSHKHPPRNLSVLQACVGRSDSFSLSASRSICDSWVPCVGSAELSSHKAGRVKSLHSKPQMYQLKDLSLRIYT